MQIALPSSGQAKYRTKTQASFLSKALLGLILLFLALFLSVLSVFLPWVLAVGFGLAFVYPVIVWRFPWIGAALTLLIVFLAPDVKWADLVTGATFVVYFTKYILEKKSSFNLPDKFTPRLYLVWMASVLLSLIVGYLYFHNSISFIYRDGRPFFYWLWIPVFVWLLSKENWRVEKLSYIFVFLGVIIATVAIIQWLFGIQIVSSGRVGALETGGAYNVGETRVQLHGYVFVTGLLIWATTALVFKPKKFLFLLPLIGISVLAIYVNYGRALWFWTAFAFALTLFYLPKKRTLVFALIASPFLVIALGMMQKHIPEKLDAAVERILSIQDEGKERSSYGLRRLENSQAVDRILDNPFFGVGLGGEYRGWLSEIRKFEEHTRYVHNGYIFIALKTGVLSLVLLCVLFLSIWIRSVRIFSARSDSPQSSFIVASIVCFPAYAGLSLTQPEIANPYGVIFLSVITVAMYSVVARQNVRKAC